MDKLSISTNTEQLKGFENKIIQVSLIAAVFFLMLGTVFTELI